MGTTAMAKTTPPASSSHRPALFAADSQRSPIIHPSKTQSDAHRPAAARSSTRNVGYLTPWVAARGHAIARTLVKKRHRTIVATPSCEIVARGLGVDDSPAGHPAAQAQETVAAPGSRQVPDMVHHHGGHSAQHDDGDDAPVSRGGEGPGANEKKPARKRHATGIDQRADEHDWIRVGGEPAEDAPGENVDHVVQ